MGAEDREFLAFSISLMAHAKNIDGSLNMLFKQDYGKIPAGSCYGI